MAIQFARCQYVSRSTGGNACRKAAYNKRDVVKDEQTGTLYYFKHREDNSHHEVLLPCGAHSKFKESSVLWNEAERAERRKDSQVCKEIVLALPDNKEISFEDRVELTRQFAEKYFVEKGVAVQMDVHAPHDEDKNWHAHLLIATRRFSKDGQSLHTHKARDLDPEVRKGMVVEADIWGEHWRELQNAYFIEKGLDLRVDAIGIVPQEHLGPVRMRHHMNDALIRSELLKEANEQIVKNPEAVLDEIVRERAVFTERDLRHFCQKHIPQEHREDLMAGIHQLDRIEALYDKETGEESGHFTTQEVRAEEQKLLRFAEGISQKASFIIPEDVREDVLKDLVLSQEQQDAFTYAAANDSNFKIIQGRAGVGKSYTLEPIRDTYEHSGYRVIGLAPTNKVARDLGDAGFTESMTCHSFLFQVKNNRVAIDEKTVLIVDEAAMMSTSLMVELFHVAKQASAKLILAGDERQLPSIERGGMFGFLAERFESKVISTVLRQEKGWQKHMAEDLSTFKFREAALSLQAHDRLFWQETKEDALKTLVNDYARESLTNPNQKRFVLAQRNVDVDALNAAIREIRQERGDIGAQEYELETTRGKARFSVGDRVQLTLTDKEQGLVNGNFGTLKLISKEKWLIEQDNGQKITFDPATYRGLRHGYAGTIYKAQGATLDHTYILHDQATNRNNSYVGLTRHSKDMKLYLSREETRDFNHFVHQISREAGKRASLDFDTLEDIRKRQRDPNSLQEKAQKVWTGLKDHFHSNEKFYQFEDQREKTAQPLQEKEGIFALEGRNRENIAEILERRLHLQFEQKYQRLPESDERLFHTQQAEKAADLLITYKEQHGRDPSYQDVNIALARSEFELESIQGVKDRHQKALTSGISRKEIDAVVQTFEDLFEKSHKYMDALNVKEWEKVDKEITSYALSIGKEPHLMDALKQDHHKIAERIEEVMKEQQRSHNKGLGL